MKKRILVITAALVLLVLCCLWYLPVRTRVDLKLSGAEVTLEGDVIETGDMAISGWMYRYLLMGEQEFKLEALTLPNREVGRIYDVTHEVVDTQLGFSFTMCWFELPEYTSDNNAYIATLVFPPDQSYWLLEVTGRIFVGTEQPGADYAAILAQCGDLVDG